MQVYTSVHIEEKESIQGKVSRVNTDSGISYCLEFPRVKTFGDFNMVNVNLPAQLSIYSPNLDNLEQALIQALECIKNEKSKLSN